MNQQDKCVKNSDATTKQNEENTDMEIHNEKTKTETNTETTPHEDWNEMLDLSVVFTPAEEKLLMEACELNGSGESLSDQPELSAEERKKKRAEKKPDRKPTSCLLLLLRKTSRPEIVVRSLKRWKATTPV